MGWLGRLDVPGQLQRWLPPWLTSLMVGAALCAFSQLMRAALQLVWPTVMPYGFLFPMILLGTLIGRWLGGLTCFLLGGLVIWFIIRPSMLATGLSSSNSSPLLLLYGLTGGAMLLVAEAYRRAHEALRREQTLRAETETEHQRLLAQELGHRIKNMLTTVQAIASQTLDEGRVDPKARQAFQDRLVALARAHDLLTEAEWATVPLDQLATSAISAFEGGGRFKVDGPPLPLAPRQAIAIALALHELATNAIKYGALSSAEGQVEIAWHNSAEGFRLSWVEQGGPPVETPTRAGFGTRLLQRNLAAELGGQVILDYARDGLRCDIFAPSHATSARQ